MKPAVNYQDFGVRKDEQPWHDMYVGTAEQLVAAGVVAADELPGQPGRCKTVAHFDSSGMDLGSRRGRAQTGAAKTIRRSGRSYCVHIRISHEEAQARWAKIDEERLQARQDGWRQGMLENAAKAGPKSPQEFRDAQLRWAKDIIRTLWSITFSPDASAFTFALTEDQRDTLAEAFEDIQDVVREARVRRDEEGHAAIEQCRRAMGARTDTSFQQFMAKVKTTRPRRTPRSNGRGLTS